MTFARRVLAGMGCVVSASACGPDLSVQPAGPRGPDAAMMGHRAPGSSSAFTAAAQTAGLSVKPLGPMVRRNRFSPLSLATYDGSGETVHPDYVAVETGRLAGHYLALTPYPDSHAEFENPAIYASTGFYSWAPVPGAPNPIAFPTERHLSDPDLVYAPQRDQLFLYYREVGEGNTVLLTRSGDGVTWSTPERVVHVPNNELVSPSVVRRSATEWLMWSVNGQSGCSDQAAWVELRRSVDGQTWSAPERAELFQPGYVPWHIEVQWIPSRQEYWAVYNVKHGSTCSTPALYLATSPDGRVWTTYPSPVIARGVVPAFADIVYRSTFSYDAAVDAVMFWYSGARYDGVRYVWSTAAQRRSRTELFNAVRAAGHASILEARAGAPPLVDPPLVQH